LFGDDVSFLLVINEQNASKAELLSNEKHRAMMFGFAVRAATSAAVKSIDGSDWSDSERSWGRSVFKAAVAARGDEMTGRGERRPPAFCTLENVPLLLIVVDDGVFGERDDFDDEPFLVLPPVTNALVPMLAGDCSGETVDWANGENGSMTNRSPCDDVPAAPSLGT
jgi:hypothetical protein